MLLVGVGDDRRPQAAERAQDLERFRIELHPGGHVEEEVDVAGRVGADTELGQELPQVLGLELSEGAER